MPRTGRSAWPAARYELQVEIAEIQERDKLSLVPVVEDDAAGSDEELTEVVRGIQ